MSNHPNRSKKSPSAARNPTPDQIKSERGDLTQTEAAGLLHTSLRAYQQWEAGDRAMHPAFWELFRLKRKAIRAEKRSASAKEND